MKIYFSYSVSHKKYKSLFVACHQNNDETEKSFNWILKNLGAFCTQKVNHEPHTRSLFRASATSTVGHRSTYANRSQNLNG